jgi:hypothetical protein
MTLLLRLLKLVATGPIDRGRAALIVVCRANLADQVSAIIKAENRDVSQIVDATADEIAVEIRQAEASAALPARPGQRRAHPCPSSPYSKRPCPIAICGRY